MHGVPLHVHKVRQRTLLMLSGAHPTVANTLPHPPDIEVPQVDGVLVLHYIAQRAALGVPCGLWQRGQGQRHRKVRDKRKCTGQGALGRRRRPTWFVDGSVQVSKATYPHCHTAGGQQAERLPYLHILCNAVSN